MARPTVFEWDDAKATANRAKHGIRFELAIGVFLDSRCIVREDDRRDYGERRSIVTGVVDGRCLTVACARRGDTCRIISARPASRRERRLYDWVRAKQEE